MWRNSFKRRRCLVLADSFYEWKRTGAAKTPMRVMLKSGEPFGFAGLWDEWTDHETGKAVRSCAIVTTYPNELMSAIHDRMPVILPRETHDDWLAPENQDTDSLRRLLGPFPAELTP
jgi:putative SOS response-associated peptidase YedK